MRHRVSHRKLGRVTEHRIAMLRNQAHALLQYERIETTVPRAKELRPFVERIITIAKRGIAGGEANGTLAARATARPARHPGSRRRQQAVRHDRAAVRGAARRLHAHPAASATAAGTAPRSPRSSSSAASTTRTSRRRRSRQRSRSRRPRASADACAPRPSACAARRRKARRTRRREGRQARRARSARGPAAPTPAAREQDLDPAKSGGS